MQIMGLPFRNVLFFYCALLFLHTFPDAAEGSLQLSRDGATQYVIITGEDAIPAEEFAAGELSEHLSKITGASFRVVSESSPGLPLKGIYVGMTVFARQKGIDFAALGDEEWIIRSYGENLVLAGGRPRGTLYAVYEFLEEQTGCRWFDEYNEIIPSIPTLVIADIDVRDEPFFWDRQVFTGMHSTPAEQTLRTRNKDTRPKPARFGFGHGIGTHTFYSYSRNFPEDKPEYHAMNRAGERPAATSGSGPGQICLTIPGAREHVLGQLRERIAADYSQVEQARDGRTPVYVYGINQNDTHWICQCADCKALAEREESDSGPLLDFVNYLADGIRDDYPEILLETWGYSNTMKPPKTIRPRDNVIIRVIHLNSEWSIDAVRARDDNWLPQWYPDYFRPRSHPVNRESTEQLIEWSRISKALAIWDYWLKYRQAFDAPYVNLRRIDSDLKLYRDTGVERMFAEYGVSRPSSFFTLKLWAGWKLMQDPCRELDELVDIFMEGYYGPAAEKMTEYLHHLEDSIAAVPYEAGNMSGMRPEERPYLTIDFYRRSQELLDEAEALCEDESNCLLNVQRERILVDSGLYSMWGIVENQLPPGETMPWDKHDLLERYENYYTKLIENRRDIGGVVRKAAIESGVNRIKEAAAGNAGTHVVPPPGYGEKNLLENAYFTDGLSGWEVPGWRAEFALEPEIDMEETREPGGASLKFRGAEEKEVFIEQSVKPVPGVKRYRIGVWYRKDSFESAWQANIRALISFRAEDGSAAERSAGFSSFFEESTTGWRFRAVEFDIPEGTSSMRVRLTTNHPGGRGPVASPPNTGVLFFDEVVLEPAG